MKRSKLRQVNGRTVIDLPKDLLKGLVEPPCAQTDPPVPGRTYGWYWQGMLGYDPDGVHFTFFPPSGPPLDKKPRKRK